MTLTDQASKAIPALQKKLDILRKNTLFAGLSQETLRCFAESATLLHFQKGEGLFFHHDKAENFFVVGSGWVKLYRDTLDGAEVVLDDHGSREVLSICGTGRLAAQGG